MSIHFPKGEGIKIIKQASEASVNDTIYILPIDERYAELIIVDKVGNKRKIGFKLPTNIATVDEEDKEGTVYTKIQANKLVKNIANSTLDTTKEGGVRQLYDYIWNISQGVGFSMYAGEDLGLGTMDTSFRLSNGYFNVTQGTGNGRTELTVQKKGIELSYSANHDSDDD
ncbi:hypothetical protein PG616_11885, partial [Riemerella anatipestifer]|nr:hypothetical protein [Riemerella anatipestifer]